METFTKHAQHNRQHLAPRTSLLAPRRGFTLVELLVVIAIIGILVALITVAAVGALKTAQRTRIKTEVTEIANGFDEAKNKFTAYPPNVLTDYGKNSPEALTAAQRLQVLNDLKRFLKQAFPRHQEPDTLIAELAGLTPSGSELPTSQMQGGMTAAEALVFWLGGFSADPKYPISGEGGPSYLASLGNADPIETRHWIYPVDVARLGPRDTDGYFDVSGQRFIEYPDPRAPADSSKRRRINFWHYTPAKSNQPFIYFDTSRHAPNELDPPAATAVHVHALKKLENVGTPNVRVSFVNPAKFQVLHCGIDDAWGDDFDRTSYAQYLSNPTLFLSFPAGPFTGDIADTTANFFTETTIEDAQK